MTKTPITLYKRNAYITNNFEGTANNQEIKENVQEAGEPGSQGGEDSKEQRSQNHLEIKMRRELDPNEMPAEEKETEAVIRRSQTGDYQHPNNAPESPRNSVASIQWAKFNFKQPESRQKAKGLRGVKLEPGNFKRGKLRVIKVSEEGAKTSDTVDQLKLKKST